MYKRYLISLVFATLCALVLLPSCQEAQYEKHIAVSQSMAGEWDRSLYHELRREGAAHPEIEMTIDTCHGSADDQVDAIRQLIKRKPDVLIIQPIQVEKVQPVMSEAEASGIPVVLISEAPPTDNYTAATFTSNVEIGKRIVEYIGFAFLYPHKMLFILGPEWSDPTQQRLIGFHQAIDELNDAVVVDSCYTDWTYQQGYHRIDSLLNLHPDIDVICCQNDPLALAAYDVCKKRNYKEMPLITGVDGIIGPGKGIEAVSEGRLTATCINPTCGQEAFHLALQIMQGQKVPRFTHVKPLLIVKANVQSHIIQENRLNRLTEQLDDINERFGVTFRRANVQLLFIWIGISVFLLTVLFGVYSFNSYKARVRMHKELEKSTQSKLDFFTNVSHSFRTPLTLIDDPIKTLLAEGGLSTRQEEMLSLVEKQTGKLQKLCQDVLNVLQSDLLKNGASLDQIARKTVEGTLTPESIRNRHFGEAAPAEEKQQSKKIDTVFTKASEMNSKTILIIDDNADVRHYLSMILEKKNYLVLTAPNGAEGLVVARNNIPDLIICDVMMPVMNGMDCCRELKSNTMTSHIPVLMLTAYALDDQRIMGYQAGADAYITKPFNTDVLCARIQNLIESRKHMDTRYDHKEQMERAELSEYDRKFVNSFHDYVVQHMTNVDLDVQQLSDAMNMSRVQLYRKCKSLTGKSPVEVIRNIRLKEATRLLKETQDTISEIAYEVGFSSPSYFAKCYKDEYNISPTEVRNT